MKTFLDAFYCFVAIHFIILTAHLLYTTQTSRLEECKKLLIALSISGILNDHSICLQTVVLCYGLLAPLLQMEIHFKPILQVNALVLLSE